MKYTRTPVMQDRNNQVWRGLSNRRRQSPAFNLTITHQMAPPRHHRIIALPLIYLPRKDERLSWPSWLTCGGRFTHIVVTRDRPLQAEHRTGSVRRGKTGVLPTVLRNQPRSYKRLRNEKCQTCKQQ